MTLTAARLRELFDYEPETGAFRRWHESKPVGTVNASGYVVLRADGRLYYAHRLAWLYMTGEWPARLIDHKNGVRIANRFENLRDATHRSNCENRLGVGAYRHVNGDGFKAAIGVDGRQIHLGYFKSFDEARAAYIAAKVSMHDFIGAAA